MVEIVFKGNDCWIDGVNRGEYSVKREDVLIEREGLTWELDTVGGYEHNSLERAMRIYSDKKKISLWFSCKNDCSVSMLVESLDEAFRLASRVEWKGSLLKTLEHMYAE